jgi:hypothetical protein
MIGRTMDMSSPASIVTREYRLKFDNTILTARLDTTKKSCLQIGSVIAVAITAGNDARIDTLGKFR